MYARLVDTVVDFFARDYINSLSLVASQLC